MLKSKKNVFWEAFMIAVVIFVAGLLFGLYMEESRSNKIEEFYMRSEISLTDAMSFSTLAETRDFDCDIVKQVNLNLADRVYEEATLLGQYEDVGKITDNMKLLHKKYDLLRSLIWTSNQDSLERCQNYNLIVYLYSYNTEESKIKATQSVWSKILGDFKESSGADALLLPIAVDQNITSLDLLMSDYNITKLPAIIVNNEHILYELDNVEQLEFLVENGESLDEIVLG